MFFFCALDGKELLTSFCVCPSCLCEHDPFRVVPSCRDSEPEGIRRLCGACPSVSCALPPFSWWFRQELRACAFPQCAQTTVLWFELAAAFSLQGQSVSHHVPCFSRAYPDRINRESSNIRSPTGGSYSVKPSLRFHFLSWDYCNLLLAVKSRPQV